jgi:hypothetical protein
MDLHPIIELLKNAPEAAGLKVGDLLQVKVLAVEESTTRALVEIGRLLRTRAAIRFPVAAGEEFQVRVTQTGSRLSLQLVRTSQGGGGPPGAPPDALPPPREGLPDGPATAARRAFAGPPTGTEPRPAAAFEALQVLHAALPAPEGRPAETLKVAWRPPRSDNPGEGRSVSILLTLDRLGAVRADLVLLDRRLDVAVFVTDPDIREFIARHSTAVTEALAGFFDAVGFHVSVAEERISRFALEEPRPGGEGRVDLRI